MPTPALLSLVEEAKSKGNHVSLQDAERYWDKAKDIAKKKFPKKTKNFWVYVTGIVKHMLGISTKGREVTAAQRVAYALQELTASDSNSRPRIFHTILTEEILAQLKLKPQTATELTVSITNNPFDPEAQRLLLEKCNDGALLAAVKIVITALKNLSYKKQITLTGNKWSTSSDSV